MTLVHLGWVGSPAPANVRAAVERVRQASPGCEVVFHDTEEMVPPEWLEVSRLLRPQMRSDVQRHAILRRYGGLWLDVDVRVVADPATWTAEWDRYTASRVTPGRNTIGTDIIYVPDGWDGWPLVDEYIGTTLATIARTKRVGIFDLAGRMIEACQARRPEAFTVLDASDRFPFNPARFTSESVVCRGCDPPVAAAAAPRRPGLGDMVRAGLARIGITEERVSKAIGKPCGCSQRAAKLNELGHRYLGLPPGETPPAS